MSSAGYGYAPVEPPPRRRGRLIALAVTVVVLLAGGGAAAVLLTRDDRPQGTPAERRAAADATVGLARLVVDRPVPSAQRLCRAVGPTTRRALDRLAVYLPESSDRCADLPRRVLRTALEPLAGTGARPLSASVDGDSATVSVDGGVEVSRSTRTAGGRWVPDPATGGTGQWRLETARRCSDALTSARLAPLSVVRSRYRAAIGVRLRGVQQVLEMLEPSRVPEGLEGTVSGVRTALAELRDGLRRGIGASSGPRLAEDAPDAAELPSLLQLVEAYPQLRDAGVPCLGGAALRPWVVDAGNGACLASRAGLDSAYRDAGRALNQAMVASSFDQLGATWTGLTNRIAALRLDGVGGDSRLRAVRTETLLSGRRTAALSALVAQRIRSGGDDIGPASRLTLAQGDAVDGLIALGFRWCGSTAG